MKKTYLVSDIKWDTDGDEELLKTLPTELEVDVDVEEEVLDDEDAEYTISEYLSDEYGFCHFGFSMKEK